MLCCVDSCIGMLQLAMLSAFVALNNICVPDPNSVMVPTQGAGTAKLGNVFNVSVKELDWRCHQEKSFCFTMLCIWCCGFGWRRGDCVGIPCTPVLYVGG